MIADADLSRRTARTVNGPLANMLSREKRREFAALVTNAESIVDLPAAWVNFILDSERIERAASAKRYK